MPHRTMPFNIFWACDLSPDDLRGAKIIATIFMFSPAHFWGALHEHLCASCFAPSDPKNMAQGGRSVAASNKLKITAVSPPWIKFPSLTLEGLDTPTAGAV